METPHQFPIIEHPVVSVRHWAVDSLQFLLRPAQTIADIKIKYLQADFLAGLTVAIVMLPQAIAYALIAELPPEMGIYAAVVASVVAILWGSSKYLHTGPTNTTSLLILSALLSIATPGTPEYVAAAGLMAIMVGIIRLLMGFARLGVLVNFVADSVVIGFTTGAGVLIAVNQIQHLLRVNIPSTALFINTLFEVGVHIGEMHWPSLAVGLITIFLMITTKQINPRLPDALIGMICASLVVALLGLDKQGVVVLGELPSGLPPLASLPLLDLELIGRLSTGSLAVAAIGLVEAMSIARTISAQSGERVDANQEFIGQGLANIATGFFSGYTCSGSFTRTAVNYASGARSAAAVIFSAIVVLAGIYVIAPLAGYLPRAALAGLLVVTAYKLVDRKEMARIWHTSLGDTTIMIATMIATIILPLEFAVLTGVLVSFGRHLISTATPAVYPMLPDADFRHFSHQPEKPECPQLGIMTIVGSLYFGAAAHVEEAIRLHLAENPEQRKLLLRMQQVNRCDISGIHMLESLVNFYRQQGGDIYMVSVRKSVMEKMQLSGFDEKLGHDHFLEQESAIGYLFSNALEPIVCIYKCNLRAWRECQNLPKSDRWPDIPRDLFLPNGDTTPTASIDPHELHERIQKHDPKDQLYIVDIREPFEYQRGHIPEASPLPIPEMFKDLGRVPKEKDIILVCRLGRRSEQVIHGLRKKGYSRLTKLKGGMDSWEKAHLPVQFEQ